MRAHWKTWSIATVSALGLYGTLNAAQAPTPTPNLPQVPEVYKFVADWPKPLPNGWTMSPVTGLFVDQNDNVWVLNRAGDAPAGSKPAPPVLEFDSSGKLLQAWGGPSSVAKDVWPQREHTIFVDRDHTVWLGGSASGDTLLKFTEGGKFLGEVGKRGPRVDPAVEKMNNQETNLIMRGIAGATFDEDAKEIYIVDGYLNRRVIVLDSTTGAFKRGWGAYGKDIKDISNDPQAPHDPHDMHAADFKSPVHCVRISKDGFVYVCDRGGDRIQVFTKAGKFVKEFHVVNETTGGGSAGMADFSGDPQQKYIFVADIVNTTVWQLQREDGKIVGHISHRGAGPGELIQPHVSAMDSKGNEYVGEIGRGSRVQKFVPN